MGTLHSEVELREELMITNEEFRKLATDHKMYSEQLDKLSARSFLSEDEKLEEVTLKKKKLLLKDQMYSILQKYRREHEEQR